jgi:serine protease inhibitor
MRILVRSAAAVLLAGAAITAGAAAWTQSAPPVVAEGPGTGGGEPLDYAGFGLGLFQRLASAAPDANVIISPVSAGLAVSMLANGAEGATLEGILRTLAATAGVEALNRGSAALMDGLRSDDLEIAVANAVWTRHDLPVLPGFLDAVRGPYAAEVASVDFRDRATVDAMNAWASRSTRGRIPMMVQHPLPPRQLLFLANAVYFKGRWQDEFRPAATRDLPFHTPTATIEHPLMHRTAHYGHLRGDGFSAVRLPYRGGRFAMYVLLPDSGVPLEAVRQRLGAEAWDGWMSGFRSREVRLALPRFRLRTSAGLIRPLSEMGMADAFDRNGARFTRLVDLSLLAGENVYVSRADQQVFIEVNEEGTEAVALTGMGIAITSAPPPPVPFIVDRPFLFGIRDDTTGALLFVGQVVDPREK